jgi:hypothetical protein
MLVDIENKDINYKAQLSLLKGVLKIRSQTISSQYCTDLDDIIANGRFDNLSIFKIESYTLDEHHYIRFWYYE